MKFPKNIAIVYGDNNKVKLWFKDLKKPVIVNEKFTNNLDDEVNHYITSLVFFKNRLIHTNYKGTVFDTVSDELIVDHGRRLMALSVLEDRLIGLEGRENEIIGKSAYQWSHLVDVESGKNLYWHKHGRNNKAGVGRIEDLKVFKGKIFFSSDSIFQLTKHDTKYSMNQLTRYLAENVSLLTNGESIYSVSHQDENTNPGGPEVRTLPENKRVAFWNYSKFGLKQQCAMKDDIIIIGTVNYQKGDPIGCIYYFKLTDEMLNSENGREAKPKLLVKNAFSENIIYTRGNPMITIQREQAEKILNEMRW